MKLFPPDRLAAFVAGTLCGLTAGWLLASTGSEATENATSADSKPPVRTAPVVENRVVPVPPDSELADEAPAGAEEQERRPAKPESPPPVKPEIVMRPATTSEEAATQVSGILSIVEEQERLEKFSRMVGLMTPENFSLYHAAWLSWHGGHKTPVLESPIYNRRAGQVAGPEVVGQRTGEGSKDLLGARTFVRDQFLGWIETDPVSAERWLDGVEQPEFRAAMEQVWVEAADAANAAGR